MREKTLAIAPQPLNPPTPYTETAVERPYERFADELVKRGKVREAEIHRETFGGPSRRTEAACLSLGSASFPSAIPRKYWPVGRCLVSPRISDTSLFRHRNHTFSQGESRSRHSHSR